MCSGTLGKLHGAGKNWACFQNNPFPLCPLALYLPLMLHCGALSVSQLPEGSRCPQGWGPPYHSAWRC